MGDLTFGMRLLRNQRAYATLTVLTIAIGIGISTTLFSVANGVLRTEGTARANAEPDAGPVAMALFGARGPIHVTAVDAREAVTAEVRPAILIMLAAAVLLFATAVANVANLQVARSTARHRELTIRAAIGASGWHLARQLLDENALLGTLGGASGVLLAAVLHRALPALVPVGFPRVDAITLDGTVLLFALALTVITSLACGILPLVQLHRLDLVRSLAEGGLASSGPRQRQPHRVDPPGHRRQPGRRDVCAAGGRHPAGAEFPGARAR